MARWASGAGKSRGGGEFGEREGSAAPERHRGAAAVRLGEAAQLIDRQGAAVGEGEPAYRYTVGQRRGLGVAAKSRLYVLDVRPQANQAVVGGEEELLSGALEGHGLHWIGHREAERAQVEATVRIRSRHVGARAVVRPLDGGRARVEFEEPQRGVTPGQAAVFYDGSRVLGGCWISGGLS